MVLVRKSPTTVNQQWDRVLQKYVVFADMVSKESEAVVREAGNIILQTTIPLTPLDTGALRASGRVFTGAFGGSAKRKAKVTVTVSFGGNVQVGPTKNAPDGIVNYAAFVHEDLPAGPKVYTTGGTGPKFLERGAKAAEQKVRAFITKSYQELFK